MASINKVILVGRVGTIESGKREKDQKTWVRVSLATSESYKNKEGEWVENVEWHKLVISIDILADRVAAQTNKGDQVYVEGRIKSNEYTNKEGQKVIDKQIYVSHWQKISSASKGGNAPVDNNSSNRPVPAAAPVNNASFLDDDDENMPF